MRTEPFLWNRAFTRITIASALSIIAGEAIFLPISLMVFDRTRSTLLTAVIMVCGYLPDALFAVLAAPLIDRGSRKRWVLALDGMLASIYLAMALLTRRASFSYGLYVAFTLATSTISVFYRLAYDAWYPDLIPAGCEQKGYAVSATLYPTVTIVMSPFAAFLYTRVAMPDIFLAVSGLLAVSILIESGVPDARAARRERMTPRQWREDLLEGFRYLRRERGIRNIYAYMCFAQGAGDGSGLLTQAFYQTQPMLTAAMLGFLRSAEMIGRAIGGALQYRVDVPPRRRYGVTRFVYVFYQLMDMLLLYMPFGGMLVNRFLCGALGVTSATIRQTAVQSYLPADMRARVNACFSMAVSVATIAFQLAAGWLGQVMSPRPANVLVGAVALAAAAWFIFRPASVNRRVYEAVRTNDAG